MDIKYYIVVYNFQFEFLFKMYFFMLTHYLSNIVFIANTNL